MSAVPLMPGHRPWMSIKGCLLPILLVQWLLSWGLAHASEPARILIVHAYSQEYPWTKGQHQGYVTTLVANLPVTPTIKTEYLDTKRLELTPSYAAWFADYLSQKYQGFSPDAIYVTDDDGLRLGLERLSKVFPQTPLFFSGVNDDSQREHLDPSRQTGVFEKKELGPNLELLEQFAGKKGSVVIVGDGSTTYRAIAEDIALELKGYPHINPVFIAGVSLPALLSRLAENPGPVLLTTLGGIKDDSGHTLNLDETISRITRGRDIVISMEDAYQFPGVLGGYVTSGVAQGQAAARLTAAYLSGTPLQKLNPILRSPNEYLFDDALLGALGLSLPEDIADQARLINPRQSFIERHLEAVLATLSLLIIAMTLVLFLLLQLRHKNQILERQSRHLQHQEQLTRYSEERYRRIFELSEDPMLLIHNRQFSMANNATAHLLGYADASELLRTHPAKLSPEFQPDGRPSFHKAEALFDEAEEKGYLRFEWEHLCKDGSSRLMQVSLTRLPPRDGAATEFLCVWHDITAWRQAEAQLIEKPFEPPTPDLG